MQPAFNTKMDGLRKCIETNQLFLSCVGDTTKHLFGVVQGSVHNLESNMMDKISSSLRQCMREWSQEGAEERRQSFLPLLNAVDEHFKGHPSLVRRGDALSGAFDDRNSEEDKLHVLVPGCGLGRLPWDFSRAGYSVDACEFTYSMLLMSSLILLQDEKKKARNDFCDFFTFLILPLNPL